MCPAVDRTAMVTGASRGIGAATARALPAAGARGVLAARDPAPPDRVADDITDAGGSPALDPYTAVVESRPAQPAERAARGPERESGAYRRTSPRRCRVGMPVRGLTPPTRPGRTRSGQSPAGSSGLSPNGACRMRAQLQASGPHLGAHSAPPAVSALESGVASLTSLVALGAYELREERDRAGIQESADALADIPCHEPPTRRRQPPGDLRHGAPAAPSAGEGRQRSSSISSVSSSRRTSLTTSSSMRPSSRARRNTARSASSIARRSRR